MSLNYDDLRDAVTGRSAGIRSTTSLAPMGGEFDKVFPPTYGTDGRDTKYAVEKRMTADGPVESVVLDSVASQANRMEEALRDAVEDGRLAVPYSYVDFSQTDAAGIDRITSFDAPHRIFDAIFRDSLLDGTLFRLTDVGRAITDASPTNAAALLRWSPTSLLFGAWDSTGPRGGLGSKYERAITSEVIANNIATGTKSASRIDPLQISSKIEIFEAHDPEQGWTLDPDEAKKSGGKPVLLKGGGEGGAGRPSQVNHGNIAPSLDVSAGGITAASITGTTVLSFTQLRRLKFPTTTDGQPRTPDERRSINQAAHVVLAALGIAAHTLAAEGGYDLRSRCVLVPEADMGFELIGRTLDDRRKVELDSDAAIALFDRAADAAVAAGIEWDIDPLVLQPAPKLVQLVVRSQQIYADSPVEEG